MEEADRLAIHVGTDWAGQPSMAEADAQRLVSGEAQRTAEHDRARQAYASAEQRWQAERQRIWQDAYYGRFNQVGGARGGRASDQAAREAAEEAVQQFERATPAPTWEGLTSPSWIRRTADKLAGVH